MSATASVAGLTRQHLEIARAASSGRSAERVYGGRGHTLRQTVIALLGGRRLDEHENPGEATVHVLQGRVRLVAGEESWTVSAGDLVAVPGGRHSLEAEEDSVVLLTTALTRSGEG
jgi:quercetin dioxygenase-like cupin family protein